MRFLKAFVLLMAIAFGRAAGSAATGSPASPRAVTITINAGETGVLHFASVGGTGGVTSITGGGTWTKRTSNVFTGTSRINSEIWTTDPGAASGTASVSVAYNGGPVAVACEVGAYTGVSAIGVAATPVGQSTSSPTISLVTQDANNWIIANFGSNDFSEAPATYTASGAGVTNRGDAGISAATDAHAAILDNTRATAGSVSAAITYAATDYSVVALELRSGVSAPPAVLPLVGRPLTLLLGPLGHGNPLREVRYEHVVAAVSGAVNMTPDVGELVIDGFAPTIGLPVTVTPGLGQLDVTGFAPAAGLPVTLRPALGALTLSGFAPTVGLPLTVAPGLGQLVLTGFAPSAGLPVTLRPSFGQLILSGFAPTVSIGAIVNMTPGTGQLIVTGFAPTIGLPVTVRPGLGALNLTGFAPLIAVPLTLRPGVGLLTLDGFAPSLSFVTIGGITAFSGELSTAPRFTGELETSPRFSGDLATFAQFRGGISVSARFSGLLVITPLFEGELETEPD